MVLCRQSKDEKVEQTLSEEMGITSENRPKRLALGNMQCYKRRKRNRCSAWKQKKHLSSVCSVDRGQSGTAKRAC